jgi:predicted nucleic acid-binding Zn ribbon protein
MSTFRIPNPAQCPEVLQTVGGGHAKNNSLGLWGTAGREVTDFACTRSEANNRYEAELAAMEADYTRHHFQDGTRARTISRRSSSTPRELDAKVTAVESPAVYRWWTKCVSLGQILSGWRDLNSRPLDPQMRPLRVSSANHSSLVTMVNR